MAQDLTSSILFLPNDVIIEIGLELSLLDISNLASTCHELNLIYTNQIFWKRKYVQDFGSQSKTCIEQESIDWKQEYIAERKCGDVWVFGSNTHGQLGLGNIGPMTEKLKPERVPKLRAIFVDCGSFHTVVIDQHYNVFCLALPW